MKVHDIIFNAWVIMLDVVWSRGSIMRHARNNTVNCFSSPLGKWNKLLIDLGTWCFNSLHPFYQRSKDRHQARLAFTTTDLARYCTCTIWIITVTYSWRKVQCADADGEGNFVGLRHCHFDSLMENSNFLNRIYTFATCFIFSSVRADKSIAFICNLWCK